MPVTNFFWDELSDNVLLETDENDVVTASYTNRPERFGELLSQKRSGVTSYFHYDGQYSTRNLTDSAEDVTDTFIYTAYGEEVARTGTTTNPFGYKGAVGYYSNSATDDLYVRARTYEPAMGCWLSKDPAGFLDGPNLYRAYFVPNGVDPTGKFAFCQTVEMPPKKEKPCGQARAQMKFEFVLNDDDEDLKDLNGWVVQRVHIREDYTKVDCFTRAYSNTIYYEAWPVIKGVIYRKPHGDPFFADEFYLGDKGYGTEGEHWIHGEVTYLHDLVVRNPPWLPPGDMRAPRQAPNEWTLQHGVPDGWRDAPFAHERLLCAEWYCCVCDPHDDILVVGEIKPTDVSCSWGWEDFCTIFSIP